ncbi:MAG TPA: hypothetical protein VLK58_28655 [Conexibacter sp.]|nr:hypothetical protein [Conexibacter sp.]
MRISLVKRAAAAAAALGAALALAAPAQAFELRSFGVGLTDPGSVANPTPDAPQLTAGAHPDVTFDLQFPTVDLGGGAQDPTESVKDVDVDLPRGLIFDPTAVPRCTAQELSLDFTAHCPLASQIGTAYVGLSGFEQAFPIYNIVPPPGVPSQFGFNVVKTTVKLDGAVRTGGDYGLSADVRGISQALPLTGTRIELWGVPADPVHDAARTTVALDGTPIGPGPANIPARPLTSNPGRCSGEPLRFTADAASWPSPGGSSPKTTTTQRVGGAPLTITGCESLPFEPTVEVQPTTSAGNSPSGLDVAVSVPQSDSPQVRSSAHLKEISILLPEGMAVNPSSADGLAACTPAQIGLDRPGSPSCPDASALGTVTIDTPLLEAPLRGRAYLASQRANPFGTTLAMYVVAEGDGVVIKLPGRIDPDPVSGRLRVTFADNPELPFDTLRVSLDGGPRAPLSTPSQCGTATATATLTPWSGGAPVQSNSSFEITRKSDGTACGPRGFAPRFSAGMANAAGGTASTFSLAFGRGDDDQFLGDITVALPEGVTGVLASVGECPEALAAAGACGAESRIGSAATTAGAGSNPLHLPGRVYLTGPYKGAPLGLSIVVPAVAGPFDLGTVAVRAALFVDKHDASLRVVSDPLPRILDGIPLQIRAVDVRIDKPQFMLNPTNCAAKSIAGRITSVDGAAVDRSSRFQVGSCGSLPFKPRMTLRIGGRGRTKPKITVPFQTVVQMPKDNANLASVRVNLPKNINARLAAINSNACSQADYDAGRCPASRAIGTATAVTPLLKRPLSGNVYFVRNPARRIPDLVMALRGQIAIDVVGKVTIPRDLTLAATFDTIPDVPISTFSLRLRPGRTGPVGTIGNLCSARVRRGMRAKVSYLGQNGASLARTQAMKIDGCARRAG